MKKKTHPRIISSSPASKAEAAIPTPKSSLSLGDLSSVICEWLEDGIIRQHSINTLSCRRRYCDLLVWFLKSRGFAECGTDELKAFFVHMTVGHVSEGGRWGNGAKAPNTFRKAAPGTVQTYYRHLRTLFRYAVDEEYIDQSPMEKLMSTGRSRPTVPVPIDRADQINPFTWEQAQHLMTAAQRVSTHPRRDYAIISFLLDTGARVSELCSLTLGDIDMKSQSAWVRNGKGGKQRKIKFGRRTKKALGLYIRWERAGENDLTAPVFVGDRGVSDGQALGRGGLYRIVARLGKAALITSVRCSPHTCRHFFAVSFLRAEGNAATLQELMGHSDIKQTMRYVRFVEADIDAAARFSPLDNLSEVQKRAMIRGWSPVDLITMAESKK